MTDRLQWETYSDVEELMEGDALPRRGAAVRPDAGGVPILYEDARPLGRVTLTEFFRDLSRGEPEVTRIQYEPIRGKETA
jgi:hypothetical protein